MKDNLIGNLLSVMHIDGGLALRLIDEGAIAGGFKQEAGEQQTRGGDGAGGALHLDEGDQVGVRLVEPGEVIDVGFDAWRGDGLQPAVEALFRLVLVASDCFLSPVEGPLARKEETKIAGSGAVVVYVEIPDAHQSEEHT